MSYREGTEQAIIVCGWLVVAFLLFFQLLSTFVSREAILVYINAYFTSQEFYFGMNRFVTYLTLSIKRTCLDYF